ncbi:MAG: hypothetical protein DRN49_04920 [Thaumarchaeota archaeon]|nr:MAG: hypothetical protein DRN49_04920 [Nitrososphaerota archaeon]
MNIDADGWEVYEIRERTISAEIEAGKLKAIKSSLDKTYAVRVIKNGRLGFAVSTDLDKAIEMALKVSKVSEDELNSFPVFELKSVKGLYDKRVEEVDAQHIKKDYEKMVATVEKAELAMALLEYDVSEVRISNSFGLECKEKSTYSSFVVEAVFEQGSAYEIEESRSVDLKIERAVKKAEELAVASSKAKKMDGGYYDIVLSPLATHQLFFFALYPSFSAENVLKGRSRLKIGEKVGSEKLSIYDDSTIDGALVSCSFDDEGVSSSKTILVENGVVKSYYTDWKYSQAMGIEPTGNGFREEVSSYPVPQPSNVVIDIKDECDSDGALIIHSFIGAHTSNPVSGDFSLECMNSEFNGEPIKGAMIYGNAFDLLNKIVGRTGEIRQVENTISASLRFSNVKIT